MNEDRTPSNRQSLFSLLKPWEFLLGILFYLLGAGVNNYLGKVINWNSLALGLMIIILLIIAKSSLWLCFLRASQGYSIQRINNRIKKSESEKSLINQMGVSLLVGVTAITTSVILVISLLQSHFLSFQGVLFLLLISVLLLMVTLFEKKLAGYIEIIQSFVIAVFIPAFGFLLQGRDLHRLVVLLSFPLALLLLSQQIASSLRDYGEEMKYGMHSLIGRMGWQRGMSLHNMLILVSYFLLVFETFVGLPWSIAWRLLLTLPVGLYQIWQMIKIASGVKPNWKLLELNSKATIGIIAYLAFIAMWIG